MSRLKLKKTIVVNFCGDSALSAGYEPLIFKFESGGVAVCDGVNPCGAHQRQAGCDGEAVTGPPEHVETDYDEQPELRLVP